MKTTKHIAIYVVDNDPIFIEEFKHDFKYNHSYTLYTFTSVQKFLEKLRNQGNNHYKIVLINELVISHGLNTRSVVEILPMIKNIDKTTAVIVLSDQDNAELKVSASDLRPTAYIKKGRMFMQKLEPTLYRAISQYELKKSNIIYKTALAIAIVVLLMIIAYFVTMAIIS